MKLENITTNLMVKNVNATLAFYKKYFDFELVEAVPLGDSGESVFAIAKSGDVVLMFQEEGSIKSEVAMFKKYMPGEGAFTLYVKVSDVRALYERVKGDLRIVMDLHDSDYGSTEFAVQDLDGYVLCFAQFEFEI